MIAEGTGVAGRRRRLLRLADADRIVSGIALDHRDSMRVVLERTGIAATSVPHVQALKLALTRVLAPAATAVMLDAGLGEAALEADAVPASVGLIMPLEAQGYEAGGDGRTTSLMDDFSPVDALRHGADACKLLVPYRADDEDSATHQDGIVGGAVADCHAVGLPLVLEPLVYRWSTETSGVFADRYPELVLAAVRRLRALGPDLLKLPFPTLESRRPTGASNEADEAEAATACRRLTDACAGTPWVLLGAGAENDRFVEQIRIAGAAGASGFLAGRGIWGAVLREDARETERLAKTDALPAFMRCRAAAERHGRPLADARAGVP